MPNQAVPKRWMRRALTIATVMFVVPCLAGYLFPWSAVNCWHEDVDIQNGRVRTMWYLWFVPVATQVGESSLSQALLPEDVAEKESDWHRVNTFSPGMHYSPHYRFHGAMSQMRMLDQSWQIGRFTSQARRASAQHLLRLWQTHGDYFGASEYLRSIAEIAWRNSQQEASTTAADLPAAASQPEP